MTFAPTDPFDESTVCEMVHVAAGVRPTAVAPIPAGSDVLYRARVATGDDAGRQSVVLKAPNPDAEFGWSDLRIESRVLSHVRATTSLPVPGVLGVVDVPDDLPSGAESLPTPFAVLEHCEGEHVSVEDLDAGALDRLAREAGRYLGELHASRSFEAFGDLEVVPDERSSPSPARARPDTADAVASAGDSREDRAWTVVGLEAGDLGRDDVGIAAPKSNWAERFLRIADASLDPLAETRFSDLEPAVRSTLEDAREGLDGEFRPVLCHGDYRPRNLLVDPDTGETHAVLDWDGATAAPGEYDLATAEQSLSGWAPLEARRREQVRRALYDGYRETNTLPADDGFAERRELYLLVTRLQAMHWLEHWLADATRERWDKAALRHRSFVERLV